MPRLPSLQIADPHPALSLRGAVDVSVNKVRLIACESCLQPCDGVSEYTYTPLSHLARMEVLCNRRRVLFVRFLEVLLFSTLLEFPLR